MDIDIRFGTLADLEAYTQLLQQTYVQAYVNYELGLTPDCFSTEIFNNLDTQKYLQSHLINTSTQKTWLAWNGDKLVGSITCILINDHEAELTGFYVHPDHQGKGIGKELYD